MQLIMCKYTTRTLFPTVMYIARFQTGFKPTAFNVHSYFSVITNNAH